MESYDVLVLGGGSAGTSAASAAHEAGARTALINDGELGGLCILRGCMPTKTLLHAAERAHHAQNPGTAGVSGAPVSIDFAAVMANKDAKVDRFQRAKLASIEGGGYDVIDARARFRGPDTVEAGGRTYRFERGAVIATGSVPSLPPIEGLEGVPYWTSDDVMRAGVRPSSLSVLGTGPIGLELGQFFARMGTRVAVFSRRRVFEDHGDLIRDEMAAAVAAEPNIELHQPLCPVRVEGDEHEVRLHFSDGSVHACKRLLVATGRDFAVAGLDLEAAGVRLEGKRVVHGDDMRTTNPRVFVAGDASGADQILHVANWEGRVAGLGAAGVPGEHAVDRRFDMQVVFTDPPLAVVGLTERQATERGLETVQASARFAETGRAITMDVQHGACQLLADATTGEVLGAQILGPRADDVIHVVSTILHYRGTVRDMLDMPWYHPTITEVLLGLARDLDARIVSPVAR